MAKLLQLLIIKGIQPAAANPRRVGTTNRRVRQPVSCGCIERNSRSVLPGPNCKFSAEDIFAPTALQSIQRHDDELFPGCEFHLQIAVVATKLDKLILG